MAASVGMYRSGSDGGSSPADGAWAGGVPLSRLNGGSPTSEAICWRLSLPSSGQATTGWMAVSGPMPRTESIRLTASWRFGSAAIGVPRWSSMSASCSWKKSMAFWMLFLTQGITGLLEPVFLLDALGGDLFFGQPVLEIELPDSRESR